MNYQFVIQFEDGGKDVVYVIDGIENHCLVPPRGFDPLYASDDELERYCFPPRPIEENELQKWEKRISLYKTSPEPVLISGDIITKPQNSSRHVTAESPDVLKAIYTTEYSSNWSGYVSDLGTSPYMTLSFSQVEMDYTQPAISSVSGSCLNAYWVGIGGCNSGNLVQAGTATSGSSTHYAWYEYLSDTGATVSMQTISSLTVSAGDAMHIYMSFEKENNKFTYYIANDTTGNAASGYVNLNANDYYDGTTCEWIVERCSYPSGYYHLGNYGSIILHDCRCKYLNIPSWYNMAGCSGLKREIMTSTTSGTYLSIPSAPYNNNYFNCTWNYYY